MSRRSQAFAEGTQKFTWSVARQDDGTYLATCMNHPAIMGRGPTEQFAMTAATKAITEAAETCDLKLVSAGTCIVPDGL